MSLGSLVSVAATVCTNLTIVLLDNNIYDVTGGQKTAASDLHIDFGDMARSIGYKSVASFDESRAWQSAARDCLWSAGPRFVWLKVAPALPDDMKTKQEPIQDQLDRVRRELARSDKEMMP